MTLFQIWNNLVSNAFKFEIIWNRVVSKLKLIWNRFDKKFENDLKQFEIWLKLNWKLTEINQKFEIFIQPPLKIMMS